MKGNSKCCDATVVNGRCFDCKDNCDIYKFDCDLCEDNGEVSTDERDVDGNWQRGVGTRKCECRYE